MGAILLQGTDRKNDDQVKRLAVRRLNAGHLVENILWQQFVNLLIV